MPIIPFGVIRVATRSRSVAVSNTWRSGYQGLAALVHEGTTRSRRGSRDQRDHAVAEQLDRTEHESLLHAHPLDPADEPVEAHGLEQTEKLGRAFLGPSDHDTPVEQLR